MADNVYGFNIHPILGDPKETISLQDFAGKVLLIVNVACEWGLTKSNYEQLNILNNKYKDQGLVIIGQPCNQFGKQEPKEGKELADEIRNKYKAEFMICERADVNGKNATELFKYLQNHKNCPGILGMNSIKWNFTKFLVNKSGVPVKRFAPKDEPFKAESDIVKLLKE